MPTPTAVVAPTSSALESIQFGRKDGSNEMDGRCIVSTCDTVASGLCERRHKTRPRDGEQVKPITATIRIEFHRKLVLDHTEKGEEQ